MKPTDRTTLVSHRGCLDGTGSALMFLLAGGSESRVIFRTPVDCVLRAGDALPDTDEVWFADCCPHDLSDPACGFPFRVFDHHVSNQRKFSADPRCMFDMGKSGTSLMYEVLNQHMNGFPGANMMLVSALEAYDLGRFDDVRGQFLADLAATYSQRDMLTLLYDRGSDIFYEESELGRAAGIRAARRIYSEAAGRRARRTTIRLPDGTTVDAALAVSPVDWKNDVAQTILSDASIKMAIIVDIVGSMASLRSRPDGPDCSLVAGQYGGGGHARAAGFKIDRNGVLNVLLAEVLG